MAIGSDGYDTFSLRLPANLARVLDTLRRKGLPAGCRPTPKAQIIERALLAYAAAEGVDVTAED